MGALKVIDVLLLRGVESRHALSPRHIGEGDDAPLQPSNHRVSGTLGFDLGDQRQVITGEAFERRRESP